MKRIIGIPILCLLASCSTTQQQVCEFFPHSAIYGENGQLGFISARVLDTLSVAGEPSLRSATPREEYRLTWLRSSHDPMIFRIRVDPDGRGSLVVKKQTYISADGLPIPLDKRRTTVCRTRRLSETELANFLELVAGAEFWTRSSDDPYPERIGTDGSDWILEGHRAGMHHFTRRWSPIPNAGPKSKQKSVQEVALDSASLYLLLIGGAADEEIY